MPEPLISIVTPVYNSVKFIDACIKSVINQEYSNIEYIVVDGGSTDGTVEIIEKYADQLAYYVSEKYRGQTHALNKGFSKATGKILAWLNADEEYLPGTLLEVGESFRNNFGLDLYYGQRIIINDLLKNK
jgi:glycosyltransferase involved in cell wall biosynthesis